MGQMGWCQYKSIEVSGLLQGLFCLPFQVIWNKNQCEIGDSFFFWLNMLGRWHLEEPKLKPLIWSYLCYINHSHFRHLFNVGLESFYTHMFIILNRINLGDAFCCFPLEFTNGSLKKKKKFLQNNILFLF